MSTQRPVIVFDRKPFPKIVDPGVGPYTLAHLTEAWLAEEKRIPNSVEDIISDIIVPRGHKSPVAGATPVMPTAEEVDAHAKKHPAGHPWGLWRLTTFDGQERVARLAGTMIYPPGKKGGHPIPTWVVYENVPGQFAREFHPSHYASMTPLKADGTPL